MGVFQPAKSGTGSGGGSANVTFLLRQEGTTDRGLLLSARGITETGHLRGEDKRGIDPPIGGHVDLPIFAGVGVARHGALRLQFPADIDGFEGVLSNNITVRLSRVDEGNFATNPTISWFPSSSLISIIVAHSTAVSQVVTLIETAATITSLGFEIETSLTGAANGSDNFLLPASNNTQTDYNVTGGRDAIQPGIELLAQPDDAVDGPNILARYDPQNETLQDLLDELEENDQGVTITIPFGTDLSAAPEAVPFVRGWQAGIADPAELIERTHCEEITFTDQTTNVPVNAPRALAIPAQTVSVRFPSGDLPTIFTDLDSANSRVTLPRGVINLNFSAIADAAGVNGEGSLIIIRESDNRRLDTLGPFSIPTANPERIQHTLLLCLDEATEVSFQYDSDRQASLLTDMVLRAAVYGLVESDSVDGAGLTEAQVRDLVRTLVKGYSLRGGPVVPDSEIDQVVLRENEVKPYALRGGPVVPESDIDPDIARDSEIKNFARVGGPVVPEAEIAPDIARDSEVPGLLSAALIDRAPGAGRNDRIPFRTRDGAWSDATSETWREIFAPYVGNWTALSGTPGFIFRRGDLTDQNGILYWLNAETRLDGDISPEVGHTYTPLNSWAGAWTDRDYKASSVTTDRAGLYLATQNVSRGDPRPSSHGTENKWVRIDDGRSLLYGGAWSSTATWRNHTILQHTQPARATYLTLRDVEAGIEPGVTADWETSYVRLGWADGAPDSVTGVTYDSDTSEIVTTQRGGHVTRDRIPTGGTNVAANPDGQDGDDLSRIAIGGINFNLPGFSPQEIGSADYGAPPSADVYVLHTAGSGIDRPATIDAGEWWGVTIGQPTYGDQIYIFPAVKTLRTTGEAGQAVALTDCRIAVTNNRGVYLAWNSAGKLVVASDNSNDAIGTVTLFRLGSAAEPPTPRPQISSFALTSGDQTPVAGSLAGETYGVAWAIAQSDHVGAARIIGFKGAFDAANATVLATIAEGDYAHGARDVVTPAGLNLADGEMYSLRLQVYGEGVTNPALDAVPDGYQDIRIAAHLPQTAAYHMGYVAYASADTGVADTLARITNFDNDTETSPNLPSRLTIDVPADGNAYQLYLIAQSDAAQPSGFTSDGLPTSSFYPAQAKSIGGVAYMFYVLRPEQRVTNADNNDYFGITP